LASLKRVVISGYYGFSNSGDEAVLSAIIEGIRSKSTEPVEIAVLSADPEGTEKNYGVMAIPRMSVTEVRKVLRRSDLFISGGGSLIQDATSFRSLTYYLSTIRLARAFGCRVMVLGQGIGPLRRRASRYLSRLVLNQVHLITVRDTQSAELLAELGICKPPIHVTADPAFTLTACQSHEAAAILSKLGLTRDEALIGVSLRRWADVPDIEHIAARALQIIGDRLQAKILMITMHTPNDLDLAKRIQQLSASSHIIIQPEPWTPTQLLGVMGRCELIIGMRLHALILAAIAGIPSVGLSYDPKVENFLRASGQTSIKLSDLTPEYLVETFLSAWETRRSLSVRLREFAAEMKEAADKNTSFALELLDAN